MGWDGYIREMDKMKIYSFLSCHFIYICIHIYGYSNQRVNLLLRISFRSYVSNIQAGRQTSRQPGSESGWNSGVYSYSGRITYTSVNHKIHRFALICSVIRRNFNMCGWVRNRSAIYIYCMYTTCWVKSLGICTAYRRTHQSLIVSFTVCIQTPVHIILL